MTISFIGYESSDSVKKTQGFWCNDGMVLIIQRKHSESDDTFNGASCHLKPSELKKLLVAYEEGKEDLLFVEELRPGLLPMEEKIEAKKHGDRIIVKCWLKNPFVFSGEVQFFERPEISLSYEEAKAILERCCDTRDWYEKEIGIAPLVGTNCRKTEKDIRYET